MLTSSARCKLSAAAFLAMALVAVPSLSHASSVLRTLHPVFVDAEGICPPAPVTGSPIFCRHTIYGNVSAGDFPLPFRPWGIAYAFNCGARPGSFRAAVGIVNLDGYFPETNFNRRGTTQRGYYMETRRANGPWHTIFPAYRAVESVELDTACTFHIRAVFGTANVVARYVPPVPRFSTR